MFDIDKEILDDELHVNIILKRSNMREEHKKESKRNDDGEARWESARSKVATVAARAGDGEEISKPTDVTPGNGCGVR